MTGLDKIIEEITTEAKANADAEISRAKEEAELIVSAAGEEGKAQSGKILESADRKTADIISRGESSANLEKQKVLLAAKQQVIASMLDNAQKHLENLPEEEYFSLVLRLVEKNSLPQKGEIAFNQKDLSRLPDGFVKRLNSASKGELTVSQEPVKINSGFILIYGGIEENCSFASLLHSNRERLADEISALLFTD